MAVSVIICGLVRSPERLLEKLKNFTDWREQGRVDRIIYSTWIGEIDRYSGLRQKLEAAGVMLAEIEEPRLVLKGGHQLHQMTAYYYGLSLVEDDDQYVLRTRVDLADNHCHMLHDFEHGTPVADDIAQVGLQNKILIEYSQMLFPFLAGDAQFFGRKRDLLRLLNMSAEMEMVYNRLAVEQTFFFEPFKRCLLFQQHFYWNLPHISEIAHKRDEQLRDIMGTEPLASVVKAWWLILDRYFKIGWGEPRAFHRELPSQAAMFDWNEGDKITGADKSDVIANSSVVSELVRHMDAEEINRLTQLLRQQGSGAPFSVDEATFATYEQYRKAYSDLPAGKAAAIGDTRRVIRGAAQHFFVKDAQDNASTRYHEQITALRRENDQLKKQMNITYTHSMLHRLLNRTLPRNMIVYMKYKMPFVTEIYARHFMKKQA